MLPKLAVLGTQCSRRIAVSPYSRQRPHLIQRSILIIQNDRILTVQHFSVLTRSLRRQSLALSDPISCVARKTGAPAGDKSLSYHYFWYNLTSVKR